MNDRRLAAEHVGSMSRKCLGISIPYEMKVARTVAVAVHFLHLLWRAEKEKTSFCDPVRDHLPFRPSASIKEGVNNYTTTVCTLCMPQGGAAKM